MANNVFANGMEIACKAGAGKTICAFPDVCFTPPENPATPPGVPVPYPNTGFAKDAAKGSKNVKISNEEIMLKNKSYFKTSVGDEAGCAAKKGVISSTNKGKVYFIKWSSDVKVEGENVDRHLDMTTNNHGSPTTNEGIPWTFIDTVANPRGGACSKEKKAEKEACKNFTPDGKKNPCPEHNPPQSPTYALYQEKTKNLSKKAKRLARKNEKKKPYYKAYRTKYKKYFDKLKKDNNRRKCLKARRCMLVPYKPSGCCPGQTPHHVIDASSFIKSGNSHIPDRNKRPKIVGWKKYDVNKAPCVCAENPGFNANTHGELHLRTGVVAAEKMDDKGNWSRKDATKAGANSVSKVFPSSTCRPSCIEAQLNKYHDGAKTSKEDKPIRAVASKNMINDPKARAKARRGATGSLC